MNVLCRRCHRIVDRRAPSCLNCGVLRLPGEVTLELVLGDARRFSIDAPLGIGRSRSNAVLLTAPTVSARHARVFPTAGGAEVADAGSTYGTFLDGHRIDGSRSLRDGSEIRVGDELLEVRRRRSVDEAAPTIVGKPAAPGPDAGGNRPRMRGEWKLKTLEAAEGEQRHVLNDPAGGVHLRMDDDEVAIFLLIDGQTTVAELLVEAERRLGDRGAACVARLLVDLGDQGLLARVEPQETTRGRLARLAGPRDLATTRIDRALERIYDAGGFLAFTRPVQAALACIALAGTIAFAVVVADGQHIPFVVAGSVYAGAPVFLLGRLLLVTAHELAHGLAVVAAGRHVPRAGLRLLFVFPYAFVDVSEGWFEPRRRRLTIAAAGPASDLLLAGAFSIATLASGDAAGGDVAFQLAVGAYLGALLNLNPCLDRDGYHLLIDLLRQPHLRRRSREQLTRLLSGRPVEPEDRRSALIFATATTIWSVLGVAFAAWLASRYAEPLGELVPAGVAWALLALLVAALASPVAVALARPLIERARRG